MTNEMHASLDMPPLYASLNGISDSQIPFLYARRVGRKPKQGIPDLREILIKLQNYNHKEILLREHKHLFTDSIDNNDSSIETTP